MYLLKNHLSPEKILLQTVWHLVDISRNLDDIHLPCPRYAVCKGHSLYGGGRIAQWIVYSFHTQWPRVRILVFPKFFPSIFSMWTIARLIDSTAA